MAEPESKTLLLTDVVDSTLLNQTIGDAAMGSLWDAHDRLARDLLRRCGGTEVGRSDGFLLLFDAPAPALEFAAGYHQALAALTPPLLARVGIHHGPVVLRKNRPEDTRQGATPFEIDGVALPTAARIMAAALGGQTLLSAATLQAAGPLAVALYSHGMWRLKGVGEPLELLEAGAADSPFLPPPDSAKAYRLVQRAGVWVPAHELPNNLPADRDLLVGRLETLAEIQHLLDDGARLVTVLGLGGIGKTRVAISHARSWMADYPGGVWFCDLRAAVSASGIVHAAAQALGLTLGPADPVQQIGQALARRGDCLLILDNFEQVARHAELTVGAWLERAPAVRFIVTSREVLGIAGERSLVVPPLSPGEALQLFRQRSRAAGLVADFTADDEQALPALIELLDRLPLAIELAAARARVMPPRALLQRMGDRFKLLSARGGRHDRQTTLRATLDWSWDLLSPAERSVLAQLSVFEGGIALDAAEAVCDPGADAPSAWVPDLLQALVEKSLLNVTGPERFGMLMAVHEYAAEKLSAGGQREGLERRHGRHFAAMSETLAVRDRGRELDNLMVACRRAGASDPALAAALLRNVWAVLRLTGPFRAGLDLGLALEAGLAETDPARAIVDRVIGAASVLLGDGAAGRRRYRSAMRRAAAAGDAGTLALAQCLLADQELTRGDATAAQALLDEAAASPALRDDPLLNVVRLNGQGKLHVSRSNWGEAQFCYEEALFLARRLGDSRWQVGLYCNLGMVAWAEGRRQAARENWEQGLCCAVELGDLQFAGNTRCNLGLLLLEAGELQAAESELHQALQNAQLLGHRRLEATVLCNLGLLAERQQDLTAACRHQARALVVARALGDLRLEGQICGHLGLVLALQGQHAQAQAALDQAAERLHAAGDAAAMAMLWLQTALAATLAGDPVRSAACRSQADDILQTLCDGIDPEVLAVKRRLDETVARRPAALSPPPA
jgi:predicted ATPase/class 3 adenylate cyclase